jgi:DnaJ-class molecular chaperone
MTKFAQSRFSVGSNSPEAAQKFDANYEKTFGKKQSDKDCEACKGTGKQWGEYCISCKGTGLKAYCTLITDASTK